METVVLRHNAGIEDNPYEWQSDMTEGKTQTLAKDRKQSFSDATPALRQ